MLWSFVGNDALLHPPLGQVLYRYSAHETKDEYIFDYLTFS